MKTFTIGIILCFFLINVVYSAIMPQFDFSIENIKHKLPKETLHARIKRSVVPQGKRICKQGCPVHNFLLDEVITSNTESNNADVTTTYEPIPPAHPAQYIVDDLRKPTTTAPQSYLRSLCTEERGVFAHPLDCRKFVDCWHGRVREKYCPDDQVFSDLPGGFCDYLEYVDCGSRPVLLPITNNNNSYDTTTQQYNTTVATNKQWPKFQHNKRS